MKVTILGGGLAGCTIGYLLKKKGYEVIIVEQNDYIGGICQTHDFQGINYEFGPHVLYAKKGSKAYEIFTSLMTGVKQKKYFPRLSIDGDLHNLCSFPPTTENVMRLKSEERDTAIEELYKINLKEPNYTNMEDYIISRVGQVMYKYYFENYNTKHWGIHPKNMDTEWAKFRNFLLRSKDYGMFGDTWQGHPGSYRNFFNSLTKNIKIVRDKVIGIEYKNSNIEKIQLENSTIEADMYISTIPIDNLLNLPDQLKYRGVYKIFTLVKGKSGLPTYLCTFPNNYNFTRIVDYTQQANQITEDSIISFAFPFDSDLKELPVNLWKKEVEKFVNDKLGKKIQEFRVHKQKYCYPISTVNTLSEYNDLIKKVSKINNVITFGRLGLYSYISMCTIVEQAYSVSKNFEQFKYMTEEDRYNFYKNLREKLI